MSEEEIPHAMTQREEQLFQSSMDGIKLFEAATEEQAKEIKRDFFGTDDDLALLEIFKDILYKLRPSERDVVWNTLIARLGLQDLDMTIEEVLDLTRSKLIHEALPILHWSPQPLPRVEHMDDGTAYTITEAELVHTPCLPADPTNTSRPIPMTNHPIEIHPGDIMLFEQGPDTVQVS